MLDKKAATLQANYNLKSRQLRDRFSAALKREEVLLKLWEATSEQVETQKSIMAKQEETIILYEEEIATREEQLEKIRKVSKAEKRASFIRGGALGIIVGVVGIVLITN